MIFLTTERTVLRRFTEEDATLMVALNADPRVTRYLAATPMAEAMIRDELMPRLVNDYPRYGGLGSWAGFARADGAFLGWFMLRPMPEAERAVELGYRVAPEAWGRGYATEVARALVRKAFTDHDIERVVGLTMAVNLGSRRVLEKAGLAYVRTFHGEWPDVVDGDEHGDVEYALTRADWASAAAAV